ncbi:M23 family metallopeptidase [Camelliibacillus cellulosilyticus]|uniref:M23 family metallopeptidase n=1 Tax=Camelliibacillus cellulosilyticus TaxID=2174486 RepID=A0ABV9GP22_9BACL
MFGLMMAMTTNHVKAAGDPDFIKERRALYLKTAAMTGVPWNVLAAVDQYERNVRGSRRDLPDAEGPVAIWMAPERWAGTLNPEPRNPFYIDLFNGFGKDGNGDGQAMMDNPEDALFSMADYLSSFGLSKENLRLALWNYYHKDKAVAIIMEIADMYKRFGTIDLGERAFPIPRGYRYDYRSTWGARRGWGGLRIHEGTDLFADYGTPVRATSYGVIEMKGWNRYGGWRLGIRDPKNVYHYYGHLSGYAKNVKKGGIVKPGQMIGYVGSSGYGPEGTQGKFPPHLHYGMYKDNGKTEFSFDPYPYLRAWERQERMKK